MSDDLSDVSKQEARALLDAAVADKQSRLSSWEIMPTGHPDHPFVGEMYLVEGGSLWKRSTRKLQYFGMNHGEVLAGMCTQLHAIRERRAHERAPKASA